MTARCLRPTQLSVYLYISSSILPPDSLLIAFYAHAQLPIVAYLPLSALHMWCCMAELAVLTY